MNPCILNAAGLANQVGKRGRKRERRLMKGFDFNFLFMDSTTSFDEPDIVTNGSDQKPLTKTSSGGEKSAGTKSPTGVTKNRFARLARGLAGKKAGGRTNKWRQLIEATRSRVIPFSRSSESVNSIGQHQQAQASQSDLDKKSDLDASVKRSLFAKRRSTSLLKEESQSQDADDHPATRQLLPEPLSKDDKKPSATTAQTILDPKEAPLLMVTLPAPVHLSPPSLHESPSRQPDSRHNLQTPDDQNRTLPTVRQSSSRSPSRSPSKSPSPATLNTSVLIGLTQVRKSRKEWI